MKRDKTLKPGDDECAMGSDARTSLERREFLKLAGGGLVVFFAAGDAPGAQIGGARGADGGYPDDPNAYLKIGADGRVTCFTGKIEMGQGIVTSLAMMLAEELDVPLDAVDMVMGDTDLCPYDAGTFGSRSIKYFGPPLRQAAAEARGILLKLASARLGIAEDALLTKDGAVHDREGPGQKGDLRRARRREEDRGPPGEQAAHQAPRQALRLRQADAAHRRSGQGHGRSPILRRHPAARHALRRDPAAAGPRRDAQERRHLRGREIPRRPGRPRRRPRRGPPREARPGRRGSRPRRSRVRALALEARRRQHLRPHQDRRGRAPRSSSNRAASTRARSWPRKRSSAPISRTTSPTPRPSRTRPSSRSRAAR
ncbi:MAG: molybdopterin-dependent oxidoreductase [Sphingobacterium sp.]|nr:molybdopterin-dependent oxidoreductase [Sphingobacterium sp.]